MSYRLVDFCFDIPQLSLGEFAVLAAMARYSDGSGYVTPPSLPVLAANAHLCKRQTHRIVKKLIARKIILHFPGGGTGNPSRFQIRVRELMDLKRSVGL